MDAMIYTPVPKHLPWLSCVISLVLHGILLSIIVLPGFLRSFNKVQPVQGVAPPTFSVTYIDTKISYPPTAKKPHKAVPAGMAQAESAKDTDERAIGKEDTDIGWLFLYRDNSMTLIFFAPTAKPVFESVAEHNSEMKKKKKYWLTLYYPHPIDEYQKLNMFRIYNAKIVVIESCFSGTPLMTIKPLTPEMQTIDTVNLLLDVPHQLFAAPGFIRKTERGQSFVAVDFADSFPDEDNGMSFSQAACFSLQ